MSQSGTLNRAVIPPGSGVDTLTGNSGGAVGPDLSNNINVVGSGIITVAGNPGTNTLTISATGEGTTITGDSGGPLSPTAGNWTFTGGSTGLTFSGAVSTETLTGTLIVGNGGTGRTTLTNHGLLVGAGTAAITQLGAATSGYLPIGSTGADPVLAPLTPGTGISITNGAGSITIAATGTTNLTYTNVNTSPYVVLSTDEYLSVDCSSIAITLEFPNAATSGRAYIIKDRTGSAATHNITLQSVSGAVNIDGATTFVMNTNYESANLMGNGTTFEVW